MTKGYDTIAEFERDGFLIVVDKTWEDIHPGDCFDDTCHDIKEISDKIDRGIYEWFLLRVRVMLDGHVLGQDHLGGCLYENAKDVLTDGTAEDLIFMALEEAKTAALDLKHRLVEMNLEGF